MRVRVRCTKIDHRTGLFSGTFSLFVRKNAPCTLSTPSSANCTPYIGACYVTAIVMWSKAVGTLGKLFATPEVKVDNTPKLESIGQAITIIKGIEDAKSEKRKNGDGKNKAKK